MCWNWATLAEIYETTTRRNCSDDQRRRGRGSKRWAGQGTLYISDKILGKAANFQQRLLVLVPNFAIFDENFQTKIRFSYNFPIAQNFGRVRCPLAAPATTPVFALTLPRVLRAKGTKCCIRPSPQLLQVKPG